MAIYKLCRSQASYPYKSNQQLPLGRGKVPIFWSVLPFCYYVYGVFRGEGGGVSFLSQATVAKFATVDHHPNLHTLCTSSWFLSLKAKNGYPVDTRYLSRHHGEPSTRSPRSLRRRSSSTWRTAPSILHLAAEIYEYKLSCEKKETGTTFKSTVEEWLGFAKSTANQYSKIGEWFERCDTITPFQLSLPPSWGTIYEIIQTAYGEMAHKTVPAILDFAAEVKGFYNKCESAAGGSTFTEDMKKWVQLILVFILVADWRV